MHAKYEYSKEINLEMKVYKNFKFFHVNELQKLKGKQ